METSIKLNPNLFCRICLSKSTDMRSLTSTSDGENRTLLEILIFIVNLDIKSNKKLPAQLCSECVSILCKADSFKRRCIESEAFLKDHVNIDELSQLDVITLEKIEVKEETTVKKSKSSKVSSKRRSVKSEKLKKPKVLEQYDNDYKDKKDGVADVLPVTFDSKISEILDLKQDDINMQVKTESLNDDIDMDMDFMDSDYDTPLITLKQENGMKFFSCSCGDHFTKETDYKLHIEEKQCNGYTKAMNIKLEKRIPNGGRKISVKRKIICPECSLEFDTVKACKLHQQTHKNSDDDTGIFECNKCMRTFTRKSSYTTHINHHDVKANVKYTCDTCKREFQHRAHLDNHILALHTRDKGYFCDVCSTNFSTPESLEAHRESHKTEKKHQCKLCKKAFYMLSTLNDHMRTHTGEKPFLCSVCGKGFSQKTNLGQHVRRHQGLKRFKCEDCDKSFVSKGELVAHNRKHSGAHPFICDDCGAGFTTSSSLVKHRRIHTGERPYACDLCPMRFAASGTLKNHRRTHTGEKPFQCSYCEKAFVQRHDLISHIRCHTGERPFACECGLAFRKLASLRHHAKTHSRDAPHALLEHERLKMAGQLD